MHNKIGEDLLSLLWATVECVFSLEWKKHCLPGLVCKETVSSCFLHHLVIIGEWCFVPLSQRKGMAPASSSSHLQSRERTKTPPNFNGPPERPPPQQDPSSSQWMKIFSQSIKTLDSDKIHLISFDSYQLGKCSLLRDKFGPPWSRGGWEPAGRSVFPPRPHTAAAGRTPRPRRKPHTTPEGMWETGQEKHGVTTEYRVRGKTQTTKTTTNGMSNL